MKSGQKILLFNAAVFGLVGLSFLLFPATMANFVTGTAPKTASGLIDMRATYGGALLGFGIVLQFLNSKSETRRHGLYALIAVLGGMAFGRMAGMLMDGPANAMMYVNLIYELFFVGASLKALRQMQ